MAIYSDNGGKPGTLQASTNESTPSSTGWLTLNTTSNPTLSAGTYWISFLTDNAGMTCRYKSATYSEGRVATQGYGSFPSIWPTTGDGAWGATYSLYATLGSSGSTSTPTPTPTPTAGASITIGDTTIEANADNNNNGVIVASKCTLGSTKSVKSISIYLPTISGKIRLGIYSNNGGKPGTLQASTSESTPGATGWLTLNTTTTPSLTSGTYWIAFLTNDNGMYQRYKTTAGTEGRVATQAYGSLPSTWPSAGDAMWGATYSLYATLN